MIHRSPTSTAVQIATRQPRVPNIMTLFSILFPRIGSACRRVALIGFLAWLLALTSAVTTHANSPELLSILPRGVQRGAEHTILLRGNRLENYEELFCYDEGIEVLEVVSKKAKQVDLKIKVAPNCRLGEHVLQIRTQHGITGFRTIFVGALPGVKEVEPNNYIAEAQAIEKNVTVEGIVLPEDVDLFKVSGKKGERLSVEIEATRLAFLLDTAISIRTAVIKDGVLNTQAGAGIVADSVPKYEWKETLNKARAIVKAAEMASGGLGFNQVEMVQTKTPKVGG